MSASYYSPVTGSRIRCAMFPVASPVTALTCRAYQTAEGPRGVPTVEAIALGCQTGEGDDVAEGRQGGHQQGGSAASGAARCDRGGRRRRSYRADDALAR